MKLEPRPWYNCLAWAFAQVLGMPLTYRFGKYILNAKLPIAEAFSQKASEFGISVMQVDTIDELQNFEFGFIVYGYFQEEIPEGRHTTWVDTGFHVVLCQQNIRISHQNGCGVLPNYTTMGELQKMGYENPKFFAVTQVKEQV